MALPSTPPLVPVTQARSGIERSGVTRAGAYRPTVVLSIDGTVRSNAMLAGSLRISLAANDQADRAFFTLTITAGFMPLVGQQVAIALGSVSNPIFAGQILRITTRRRPGYWDESPFVDVDCLDWTRVFDARLVTFEWRSATAAAIVTELLARWVPTGFTMFRVSSTIVIPNLAVINERPTTVLRRLTTLVGGHFYIDPRRDVHLWEGETEADLTQPTTLTKDLSTLKAFSETIDCSQVRTRVQVEGKRTTTPLGIPAQSIEWLYYMPLDDQSIFLPVSASEPYREIRVGAQHACLQKMGPTRDMTLNAPGSVTTAPFDPAVGVLTLANMLPFPPAGVVKAGDQLLRYSQHSNAGTPNAGTLTVKPSTEYGGGSAPLATGTSVSVLPFADSVKAKHPKAFAGFAGNVELWRAQGPNQPVVLVVRQEDPDAQVAWAAREGFDGLYEHLIQDGRFSVDGATSRAAAELAQFTDAHVSASWETEDMNALPGRRQDINFGGAAPLVTTLVIDTVELTVPVANYWPRRTCQGSSLKLSRLGDLLITDVT